MSDNLTEPTDVIPELDRDALAAADLAYLHTEGTPRDRVRAAVFAYEYADANMVEVDGMWIFPSPEATAAAYTRSLADRGTDR